jgi:hypothetical protein
MKPAPFDWVAWHADYEDRDSALSRRLAIVQRHIRSCLEDFDGSPLRVVSMCAGEARDLVGSLAQVERRDLVGRLVEINPELAAVAQSGLDALGVSGVEVIVGDAGESSAYRNAVPADLVLACGVFGNVSDDDIERTVRAFPSMCAPGGSLIWTRRRGGDPDMTVRIREWLTDLDFENIAFEPVPDAPGSVGVARFRGETQPLVDQKLFTFIRTA